jgi:hypothetical protein
VGSVVGISSPQDQKENNEFVPDPERVKFVQYIAGVTEAYLNGNIDIVMIGFVDPQGIPFPGLGPYPPELVNDVLALAIASEAEVRKGALAYYDEDKESV